MKKVYIAGPISNRPANEARADFKAAENSLRLKGYDPVNPMELPHDHDKAWSSYMLEDITQLIQCDAIHMLPGWNSSKGAVIEYQIAQRMNLPII